MKKLFDTLWKASILLAFPILCVSGASLKSAGGATVEHLLLSPLFLISFASFFIAYEDQINHPNNYSFFLRSYAIFSLFSTLICSIAAFDHAYVWLDIVAYVLASITIVIVIATFIFRKSWNSARAYCPKLARYAYNCCESIHADLIRAGVSSNNSNGELLYQCIIIVMRSALEEFIPHWIWYSTSNKNGKNIFVNRFVYEFDKLIAAESRGKLCDSVEYESLLVRLSPEIEDAVKNHIRCHSIHMCDFSAFEFSCDLSRFIVSNGFATDDSNNQIREIADRHIETMKNKWLPLVEKKNSKYNFPFD